MIRQARRPFLVAGATTSVLALMLGLAACSGSDGGQAQGAPTTARIDIDTPVESTDPVANTFLADNMVGTFVNGTLFAFEKGSATETQPVIAESATASDDLMSWQLVLKPDLTFSDGTPLDAAAVAASIGRLQSTPGVNADDLSMIEQVTVVDEVTLELTLDRAEADLEQYLAVPSTAIVPPAAADDPDYYAGENPAYSGAFVPESDVTANSFTLVRNDAFAGSPSVLESIEFTVISDTVTSATRLQGGETDVATVVPLEQAAQMAGDVVATSVPQVSTVYLLPNNRAGSKFAEPRLRQALAWAIDREELAALAYGANAVVQNGPYPVPADYPQPVDVYPEQDLDKARELLAGTECASGCTVTATYFASSESDAGRIAVGLQQMLEPLGITIQPSPVDNSLFIQNSLDGTFDMNIAVSGAFNVPNSMLSFRSDEAACVYTGCENPDINAALDGLLAAPDDAAREAASEKVLTTFQEWTPIIPVAGALVTYGVRSSLQDVVVTQPNGVLWVASE